MTAISLSTEDLQSRYDQIAALDEQIAAASGSKTAGKRALANTFVEAEKVNWEPEVESFLNTLGKFEGEQLVGFYTGFMRNVEKAIDEKISTWLDEYVEANKTETPEPVSEEDLDKLVADRKKMATEYNALRELLEMFGHDVSGILKPKKMTGARGKRGPRAISNFTWSVDGVEQAPGKNTIAGVASEQGFESAKDLRDLIRAVVVGQDEKGADILLDIKKPPALIELDLPNGKHLVGTQLSTPLPEIDPDAPDTDDDDDDDDDFDDDENGNGDETPAAPVVE